jgi:hypothetical protein
MEAPSTNNYFRGTMPFKVQVNFYIPLFEGQINVYALEKWLCLLEDYFFVQKFFTSEKITFAFLKPLPHVRYSWDSCCEKHVEDECEIFKLGPTWAALVDALKDKYYPVGNYDDQYMRWTTLRQQRGEIVPKFKNTFHTLHIKLGIKYYEPLMILKYFGALHRYIQTEMGFLGISSLRVIYRYFFKFE